MNNKNHKKDAPEMSETELLRKRITELEVENSKLQMLIEERKTLSELKNSKEEWEDTFNAVPDMICILDNNHTVTNINRTMTERLGLSAEEVIGKKCYECIHNSDAPPDFCPHTKLLQTEREQAEEVCIESLDGIFSVSVTPLLDKDGSLKGAVHVARDITEIKKSAEQLQLNERRLQSIVNLLQYQYSSFEDFLDHALNEAIELTSSKIGYIYHYDENKEEFTLNSWSKNVMKECSITQPQTVYHLKKTGIWGEVVRQRKPLIVNDFAAENPLRKGYPEGHAVLKNFLTVPVFREEKIIAVIGVGNKEADYNDTDILHLSLLMDSVWQTVDRKRAQYDLKESHERLLAVFNSIDAMIYVADMQTYEVLFVNEFGRKIWGDIQGKKCWETIQSGQTGPCSFCTNSKILDPDGFPSGTYAWQFQNTSTKKWFDCRDRAIQWSDGRIVRLEVATDITEDKAIQEDLFKTKERLELATKGTGIGIWDYHIDEDRLEWDEIMFELFDVSADNFKGSINDFKKCVLPAAFPKVMQQIEGALSSGNDFCIEFPIKTAKGEIRSIAGAGIIKSDEYGKPVRAVGINYDITERKNNEAELIKAKEYWEKTFNTIPDLITILDKDYRILRVNKAMADRMNCNPLSCIGRKCYPDVHGADKPPEICPFSRLLTDGKAHSMEIDEPLLGGIFEVTVSPLFDDKGEVQGCVHVAHDVTERKKMEKDILTAKEQAEAANIAKSRFLANMSHEIRTPMAGIMGAIEMLIKKDTDPQRLNTLDLMMSSAKSLLNIINDILDLSKIEAGKVELFNEDFRLDRVLKKAVSLYAVIATEKGLKLGLEKTSDVPENVHGDPQKLEQILKNLLYNAIKFTPSGSVLLKVSIQDSSDDRCRILFEVRDSGIGIPSDVMPRLFKSFSQADSSYKKRFGGTGLGLAISKNLVEIMGGKIWAESLEGKGSSFYFTVPFTKAVTAPTEPGDESVSKEEGIKPYSKVLNILVAEDVDINKEYISFILNEAGHQIVMVSNGKQAVEAYNKEPFDLILMDIQMPEMDGMEAAKRIRDIERKENRVKTPIIALTAYAMKEEKEKILESGMDGYVTKPVDSTLLSSEISRVMAGIKASVKLDKKTGEKIFEQHKPAVDKNVASKRYGGRLDLWKKLLNRFIEKDIAVYKKEISRVMDLQKFDEIYNMSHKIKGSLGVICAEKAMNTAQDIELAAKNEDIAECRLKWIELQDELDRIVLYEAG